MTMMIMIKSSKPRRDPAKAGTLRSLSSCSNGEVDWLCECDGLSDSLVIDSELDADGCVSGGSVCGYDSPGLCVSNGFVLVAVGSFVGVKNSDAVNMSVGKPAFHSSRLSTSYLSIDD